MKRGHCSINWANTTRPYCYRVWKNKRSLFTTSTITKASMARWQPHKPNHNLDITTGLEGHDHSTLWHDGWAPQSMGNNRDVTKQLPEPHSKERGLPRHELAAINGERTMATCPFTRHALLHVQEPLESNNHTLVGKIITKLTLQC